METRLEIFTNGLWRVLELFDRDSIKYNKVINKIDSLSTREISHSNTLSIPTNYNNRTVLGMNVFNKQELAKALNSRYPARYFIEDRLIQEGLVVINRTTEIDIRLNFIDTALEIVDFWGEVNLRELINSGSPTISEDYREAINELKTYTLSTEDVAQHLSEVGTRGYNLCLFPNSLNAIGDEFMVDANEIRPTNSFNPYQSRPIFNAKSVFDLACEAFGYTPIFDNSVDWEEVSEHYIVSEGLADNFTDEGDTLRRGQTISNDNLIVIDAAADRVVIGGGFASFSVPDNIVGWSNPETGWDDSYRSQPTIFRPEIEAIASGIIRYRINYSNLDTTIPGTSYSVWRNISGTGVIFKELLVENPVITNSNVLEFDINKVQLATPPLGGEEFLGVLATVETDGSVFNTQVTETFLPLESVSYDERGQFESQSIDLSYGASDETVKALLLGLMNRFGILMNINSSTKEVLFFNYARYLNMRRDGIFTDLSDYLLEYEPYEFNTEFGNSFGKFNEISLASPFRGNTFTFPITNQGNDSKLKDFATNRSTLFNDITAANRIRNSITPYVEFTCDGLCLVQHIGNLGDLTQIRFIEEPTEGNPTLTTQGIISELPRITNTSFSFLPIGVSEWYRLVQDSIKARPKFLLPTDVARGLDLTIPVYIEQLGGFYIVEELGEYENPQNQVTVEVIRLISGAEFSDDFSHAFNV